MKYYVYYYLSEDGLPYYVGKGCGKRARAKHKYVCVPPQHRIRFLITNTTEEWALYKEAAFIDRWGTQHDGTGILENTCDKPHPTNNKPHSEEAKKRMSEAQKEYWKTHTRIAWNKGVSGYTTSWKGRKHSEETKKHLSTITKGRPGTHTTPHTEESKRLMRQNHPKCLPVVVDGVSYSSVSEAARQLGVSTKTIRRRRG